MNKKLLWLLIIPAIVLLICLTSCASVETGTLNLVSPTAGITYHDDSGIAPVVVHSSFTDTKIAAISLNGAQVFICTLVANADTTCSSVQLPKPGVHNIAVTTYRKSGEVVTAQTTANWSPYTAMDKLAQSLAGGEGKDPAMGYALGAIFLIIVMTIVMAVVTHGSPTGAIAGFFLSLVIVAILLFVTDSVGSALFVLWGVITLAGLGVVALLLAYAVRNGYAAQGGRQAEVNGFDHAGRPLIAKVKQGAFIGLGDNLPLSSGETAERLFDRVSGSAAAQLPDSI